MQLAASAPQIYDIPELHKQMLETIGIENVDKLIPSEEEQKPTDPVSENMDILTSKPVKAFIYQDHEAHIKVHMNLAQDPHLQKIMAQNPNAEAVVAAGQAHVAEHVAFLYRSKLEEQLGVPLPPPDEKLPEDVEVQLSRLVADASEQLLQQNQAQMAQEQAQQQAQDPGVQMQQQELQIKQGELQRKTTKDQTDVQIKQAELQLDAARIQSQEKQTMAKVMADAAKEDEVLEVKKAIEGAKLGANLVSQTMSQSGKVPEEEG